VRGWLDKVAVDLFGSLQIFRDISVQTVFTTVQTIETLLKPYKWLHNVEITSKPYNCSLKTSDNLENRSIIFFSTSPPSGYRLKPF
jgi:hypothetical protein